MAGGKWTILDTLDPSQRSGFYINFVAEALDQVSAGSAGVVAIPVTAPWGPEATIVEIANLDELDKTFSKKDEGTAYFQISQALKGKPAKVLAYRMANGATKATTNLADATAVDLVTVTAKYSGSFGNDLTVTVADSLTDPGKKEFRILNGSVLLEKYVFDGTADNLITVVANSEYVTLTKLAAGTLANVSDKAPTGGASGTAVTATEYADALTAFEGQAFRWSTLGVPSSDDTFAIQTSAVDFVKRLRSEGFFVNLVLGHYQNNDFAGAKTEAQSINSEAVIYSYIGAVVGGVTKTPADMVGRIAGMVAGAGADTSLTYAVIDGIDSLANVLTNAQVREALKAGVLIAFNDGDYNRIEKGINTLTTYAAEQHEGYSKIKVMATLDAIGTALTTAANNNFIGKVINDEEGQKSLLGAMKTVLDLFVQGRMIKPDPVVELDTSINVSADQVAVRMSVTPLDAMEEMYTTVMVGR